MSASRQLPLDLLTAIASRGALSRRPRSAAPSPSVMGWGGCNVPLYKRRRRPRGQELPPDSPLLKLSHCDEFVWNVGAAVSKTVCFAGFVLAEWPRRLIALSTARPFPPPLFTCAAAGGYRVCACGHHFYEHAELITGPRAPSLPPEVDAKMKKKAARRVRRRRWFWPF